MPRNYEKLFCDTKLYRFFNQSDAFISKNKTLKKKYQNKIINLQIRNST